MVDVVDVADVADVVEAGAGKLPLSWYISSLLGPPQYSVSLPPHSMEQPLTLISVLGWLTEPALMVLPQ